ncbi:hypothetical protein [Azospirillum sp. sgz301742]
MTAQDVAAPIVVTVALEPDPILRLCHICRGTAQVILSLQAVYAIDDAYIAAPVSRLMAQVTEIERLHREGKLHA